MHDKIINLFKELVKADWNNVINPTNKYRAGYATGISNSFKAITGIGILLHFTYINDDNVEFTAFDSKYLFSATILGEVASGHFRIIRTHYEQYVDTVDIDNWELSI